MKPQNTLPKPSSRRDRDADEAHLGTGARIEGKLTFKGNVRIEGQIEGEIHVEDTVTLGEAAQVNAQVEAGTVISQGRITGDITARTRVELRAPASVVGNITTPNLVIHEGVMFEGRCTMGNASNKPQQSEGSGDKRVAIFPTEEGRTGSARAKSGAAGSTA